MVPRWRVAMTDDETRVFLPQGTRTGKIAWTAPSGRPTWRRSGSSWTTTAALEVVFNTGADTAKGRALRRDPRVSMLVDDEHPPFALRQAHRIRAEISEDLDEVRRVGHDDRRSLHGPRTGPRSSARRNGVPGELLVRLRPTSVQALTGIAD